MNISLNGETTAVENGITVENLLSSKNLDLEKVIVEYNLELLSSLDWSKTVIKENDSLEVLRFVGGG